MLSEEHRELLIANVAEVLEDKPYLTPEEIHDRLLANYWDALPLAIVNEILWDAETPFFHEPIRWIVDQDDDAGDDEEGDVEADVDEPDEAVPSVASSREDDPLYRALAEAYGPRVYLLGRSGVGLMYLVEHMFITPLDAEAELELFKRHEAELFAREMLAEGKPLEADIERDLQWIVQDGFLAMCAILVSAQRSVIEETLPLVDQGVGFEALIQMANAAMLHLFDRWDYTTGAVFDDQVRADVRETVTKLLLGHNFARFPEEVMDVASMSARLDFMRDVEAEEE